MKSAHDLLGISLETLETINDDALKTAYEQKVKQEVEAHEKWLESIKIIENEELERKKTEFERMKTELKNAFESLQTIGKRALYLKQMNQPTIAMNTVKTKEGISAIPIKTTGVDIVQKYRNYIDKKIKNIEGEIKKLDQSGSTYKQTKENLEKSLESCKKNAPTYKKNAEPKEYSTFDDFQKSEPELYKSMSKEEQNAIKDHFTKHEKVTFITLTFDSFEEATGFIKDNFGIEKAREFIEKAQQKDSKIDPTVLDDNLKPQEKENIPKPQEEKKQEEYTPPKMRR